MAYFIRKALSAGPIRFNLSKSGVGVSAGVTGARLGLNRQGTYVYGGRHGLYYRKQLSRRTKKSAHRGQSDTDTDTRNTGIVDLFTDTGQTYPPVYDLIEPRSLPELSDVTGLHHNPLIWILLVLSFSLPLLIFDPREILPWLAPALILLLIVADYLRHRSWIKKGKTMVESMAETFENDPEKFSVEPMNEFTDKAPEKYSNRFLPDLYLVLMQIMIEKPDDRHVFPFNKFEKQIPVSEEFIDQTKKAVLTNQLDAVLADHMLTREEEQDIRHLIDKLYLDDNFVFEELQYLNLASTVRNEIEAPLTKVIPSIPLVQGEACYGEFNDVRLLEERIIDRFKKDKIQYRKIGYETMLEGKLILTDRRCILLGDGSREYRLNKILKVITVLESNTLELVISGRENPVYLTALSPLIISSRIEKILNDIVLAKSEPKA